MFLLNNANFSYQNVSFLLLSCFTVAPIVSIISDKNWHAGQENVMFTCSARANPPAHRLSWIRSVFPKLPSCGNRLWCFKHTKMNEIVVWRREKRWWESSNCLLTQFKAGKSQSEVCVMVGLAFSGSYRKDHKFWCWKGVYWRSFPNQCSFDEVWRHPKVFFGYYIY